VYDLENVHILCARHFVFQDLTNVQCVVPIRNTTKNLKKLVYPQVMNKYERFCVDEAQYHLNRAQELLREGLRDPKRYYDEGQEFYKVMAKVFPLLILLQQCNGPQLPDQEMEESLSDTLSSTQSDSDSFEPVTPSDR
jgi:hypothetical protein